MCPTPTFSSRIEAFRRIMLLNDDGGSRKCFAISFRNTVGFFSTSWIIFTFSLFVNVFLFNAMAIHYYKITSKKLRYSNVTHKEQTLTTSNRRKGRTERGVMEESRAYDDLEQREAPQASSNTQKFPSNAKTRIKTCVGVEVLYLKCG
jgi:hypothetical protein